MGSAEHRFLRAVEHLAKGEYEEGWPLYEARHEYAGKAIPELPAPWWNGEPLEGRHLLILPDQGFGDAIQFARFVPQILAMGAKVTLLCRPPLARLLAINLHPASVLAADGEMRFEAPDFVTMLPSLGGPLGVTLRSLPKNPYLAVRHPLCSGGVGVVWKGAPAHTNDRNRSLPPDLGEALLALPGAVPLAPEETGAKDFYDTAGIIAGLDLVITVDTAVAHLAGAMGRPCWVLIPAVNTDWRWMRDREDSPWYPSVKLYRQGGRGGWSAAIDRLRCDLVGYSRTR